MRSALLLPLLGAALALASPRPAPAQETPGGVMGREGPPAPAVAKPALEPFSQTLGLGSRTLEPAVVLAPLDNEALRVEDRAQVSEELVLRTGVGREITIRMKNGRWDEVPGSGWLWSAELVSSGAKAVRVHLSGLRLPPGAQLIAYAPSRPEWISGPYDGRGPLGDGTLWTQPVPGERIRVECFVPGPERPAEDLFVLDQAIHAYRDLFGNESEALLEDTSCWVDVMCRADWITLSYAVARLDHVISGGAYSAFCSGTLLNSLNGDLTPYLLTANHCVSTPNEAQSTSARWFYQSPGCNQPPPADGSLPASGGCTVLATDKRLDFTLLMVEGTLPGGLYWAGWSNTFVPEGTEVAGIHHPLGEYKRYAGGHKETSTDPDFTKTHFVDGAVDLGSSGSGLFRVDTQQLVGQLCCGHPGCLGDGMHHYGRMTSSYPLIAGFLAGGSDDAMEPNDLCSNASPVTTAFYPNLIVKSQSPDWYSIEVLAGAPLRIELSFQHSWGDIDLQLYDGCGGARVAASAGSGNTELIEYTNTGPTRTFYMRVYLFNDTRNTYSMNVSAEGRPNLNAAFTPGGFSSPVVPRNVGNANYGYAPLTAELTFWTWMNVAVQCEGIVTAPAFTSWLDLDGGRLATLGWGPTPPGSAQKVNLSAAITRGGRHTLTHTVDPDNLVAEYVEADNAWSGQWVWDPYVLADQTPLTRPLAPDPGFGEFPNCDGFEFTGNWWGGVAICPTSADDDYDLALFNDYAGSTAGFAAAEATSAYPGGESDFALFNGNVLGLGQTRWAGVTSYDPRYGGDFVVQQSNQVGPTYTAPVTYGARLSVAGSVGSGRILQVYEVHLTSTALTYTFQLTPNAGSADLDLGLYAADAGYAGKGDYAAVSANMGGGVGESFDYRPAVTGYYALVVWKRGWADLGATGDYTLTFGPALSNLAANVMAGGWSGPIVPRNDAAATADDAQVSPTLDGNALDTYLSWAIAQYGPNEAPPWSTELRLDDAGPVASVALATSSPAGVRKFLAYGPVTVTGGRHSLTSIADPGAVVAESDEGDNEWSGQWVWSPLLVWRAGPAVRPAPPPWGTFVYLDCDGFQFTRDAASAWAVSSASFAVTDDYDLYVFDDYAGSTVGFSNDLKASALGSNSTEFVVGHHLGTPVTVYPGVTEFGGNGGGFAFDATDALNRTGDNRRTPTVTFAGQTLAANRLADVYEAYLLAGSTYHLALTRNSGSSDLMFEVFSATAGGTWSRSEYDAVSASVNATRDTILYLAPATGYAPIVVFRPTGSDVSPATYTLTWHAESSVDVPPGRGETLAFGLTGARPDPIRDRGFLEFTLAEPATARLAIHDLSGRKVRALADGDFGPGRHSIAWDGRGDDGGRLRSGVYWVRLESGGRALAKRVTLLQ
jgi:hypothetical protein